MKTFFNKIKNSFTSQKNNLDIFSKVFFSIFLLAILLSSILGFALSSEDNLAWVVTISTLSSLFGSVTVFLLATKNYNGYIYGVIQVIFYGIVSIYWSLWGQVFLSFFIYLPANISGYFLWKSNIEKKYKTKSRDISNEKFLIIIIIALLAAVGVSYIFKSFTNNPYPFLDGFITAFSLLGTVFMLLRYRKQWLLWMVVNLLTVTLYSIFYQETSKVEYIPQIMMWTFTFLNSVYGFLFWIGVLDIVETKKTVRIEYTNGYKFERKNNLRINFGKIKEMQRNGWFK